MDALELKMVNHTIDWHRPRPQEGGTLLCACSDTEDYDSYGFVAHLKVQLARDLDLYGVSPDQMLAKRKADPDS